MSEQSAVPFVMMRGGTSKALFVSGAELPPAGQRRDAMILALFGSPDPRQIDGLGGADILTSKLAIIDPPTRLDADLDFTFAQVSISEPVVDYDINCGNISAAVGAYAVDEGIVPATEPVTTVRIHNTNIGRMLVAEVPVRGGLAAIEGDAVVDGVPGSGAPIALDYSGTAGGITGSLLPTGGPEVILDTACGPVAASIVDLANLCVFVVADDVGMTGSEGPGGVTDAQMDAIAAVKTAAAHLLDMSPDGLTPIPAVVAPPAVYENYTTGADVPAESFDLLARVIGGRPPMMHKAYPGTAAACTAVAASIPGTTVHRVAKGPIDGVLTIGHTSGTMRVGVRVRDGVEGWVVEHAAYDRTARRLAEGTAYVRTAILRSYVHGRGAWGGSRSESASL